MKSILRSWNGSAIQACLFKQGSQYGFWFRILGHGVSISNQTLLFSEREGITKVLRIFNIKIKRLKP